MKQWLGIAQVELVKVDQGGVGHGRRKPITLLTNLPEMADLNGLTGTGQEVLASGLADRLRQTKGWAAWAPGLVAATQHSLRLLFQITNAFLRTGKRQRFELCRRCPWLNGVITYDGATSLIREDVGHASKRCALMLITGDNLVLDPLTA